MKALRNSLLASLAAALFLVPSAAPATSFITGAVSGYPTGWTTTEGTPADAVTPTGEAGAYTGLAFSLGEGQLLTYEGTTASEAGGTADVVIDDAVFTVAYELPGADAVGGLSSQAAICLAQISPDAAPSYYGWVGGGTADALEWTKLAGANPPADGTPVDVTMSFDYTANPATVTFKVGNDTLYPATGTAADAAIALGTSLDKVTAVSFSGEGSIAEMTGTTEPAAPSTFEVSWYMDDGTTLIDKSEVAAGGHPTHSNVVKNATAQYTYAFEGWAATANATAADVLALEGVTISAATSYYAVFTATPVSYTLTWNLDGGSITSEAGNYTAAGSVAYGTSLTAPQVARTGYTFGGWSPSVDGTMPAADTTYTATWTINTYTITWKDGDGNTLDTDTVDYNVTPSYTGATPTKAATAQYTYSFDNTWSPTIVAATEDATYTAQFTATPVSYTLTWNLDGGSITSEAGNYTAAGSVAYGTSLTAPQVARTGYTFGGWSPSVAGTMPAADTTYTATWTINSYTITWKDGDGNTLDTDTVDYNVTPSYTGATPTKAATEQYTYTFNNTWSPTIVAATADATYTAQFSSTLRSYTITWKNGDDVLETDENVEYGETPVYNGATPTKDADGQYAYTFAGWDPEVASVTGPATYTAQFEAHEIVFPTLALAKPTLSSTVLANAQSGAVVRATIDPTATVNATNATADVVVDGTNVTATFTSLPWNDPVDWMLRSENAADLPGRFYAKGEASWFNVATDALDTVTDLVEGMKGVDMSDDPSAAGQMVRIQTCLEIPEGAMEELPDAQGVGSARTGFAVAQIADNGDTAPAFYAFNGTTWDKLLGVAPVANTTNDLLIVLDVQAGTARYYVDGIALYKDNAGAPAYAIPMGSSADNAIHGIGFANADGVKAPVVAEYDVPFEAAVGDVPYAAAADGLAAADKTGVRTLYLLTNDVAGTIELGLDDRVKVDTAKGSFAAGAGVTLASTVPAGYAIETSASGDVTTYTVGLLEYPIEWKLELVGATNAVANALTNSYTVADLPITLFPAGCEGYTFDGWTNNVAAGVQTTIPAGTTGAVTNWATWHQNAFTITWNVEGATSTSEVLPGVVPTFTGTPEKAADNTYTYTFAGWAASADGSVINPLPGATEATTYFAVFTPVYINYTITWNFKAADGTDTSDTTTVHWGDVPSHADPAGYVANNTIYAFDDWNVEPAAYDGTTTAYTATYTSAAAAAMVISVADAETGATTTNYVATLADAFGPNGAKDGDTVELLANVTLTERIEPNLGENTTLVIDLGGYTITREGTSGNGSVFDVRSGDVTITNGVIVCTQDDTAIAKDGVYAITSRSGSTVTLADLTVTVDSECGACVYPFAGSTMTIESGTYANLTTTPYRYNTDITGMAVNQPNIADQLLIIKGGSFSPYDPQLGDDSGAMTDFTDDGFVAIDDGNGHWVVQPGYNVTFDANGGTPAPEAQRVAAGALVTAPATNPAKAGDDTVVYVFNAWQLNDADYDFAVAPTADITLVADYTATSLANAIWIGGASGDWNVPANWDIGYVPTKATVVTFTNDATVGIAPTVCKCKEIVLDNADVTIGRADPVTGADLNFYKTEGSAVSGTGTLALDTVGMFNQNNAGVITIGTALDIRGDVTFKGVKDGNQHAGSWTITGKTTIADGVTVKSIDDAITTFQGDIDIGAGSQVTFFAAYGANEQYHGGEIVASKVTLAHNEGSPATKLVLETRNKGKITISDSQVVTDDDAYEVKKSSADGKTTYEAVLKTFSVIWLAEDGATQLDATNGVPYGTSYASLAAPTPTKDGDANALYTLAAWTPAPDATVTSNATYTASFKTWIKVAVPTAETSLVYDGTEKTGVAAAANSEYTVSGNTATDAGSYTATATLADTANTVWADDTTAPTANAEKTIAWSIAKRAITVTAENASKIAGNPDPVFTASITSGDLAGGQEIAYTFSVTDGADAATKIVTPSATITASGVDVTANYTITAVPGALTIGDAVATVFTVADNGATTNDVAYYATFAEAVSAAQAGQTVLLLADDAAEQISFEKDLTLDLGGNTFTGRLTANAGTATVQNGTIVGRLDAYDSSVVTLAADAAVNGQVVVWGDGTFGEEGCKTPVLNVYGTVTHTGDGAITCNGTDRSGAVINVYDGAVVTSTDEIGIYLPSGNLTVTGGTITGATAVYAKSGSVNISGGTLRGTGAKADYAFMGDGANATGDALVIDNCGYPNGVPAVSVTGGTFVSDNAQSVASYAKDDTFAAVDEFIPATVDGQPNPARFSDADADGVPAGYALVLVEGSDPEMYAVSAQAPIQWYNTWGVPNVFYFDDEDPIPSRTTQGTIPTIKREGETSYHAVEDWVQISWTVTSSSAADASTPDDSIATVDGDGLVTFSQPGTVKVWLTMTDPSGATKSSSKTVKYDLAPAYVVSADGSTRTAYGSLSGAFNAAQDGETVVLGKDATVTNLGRMTLNADKAITLDLNGHTATLSQNYREGAFGALFTVNKGSLTVVDTAETKGGIAVSGTNCRAFSMDGTSNQSATDAVLTIGEGVNVSSASDCCVTVFGKATLNTAGNLSSPNDFAIAGNGSAGNEGTVINVTGGTVSGDEVAIYQPQDGELNISGGTITGNTAVYVKSGDISVTGGTLHGTGTAADYSFNGSGANATGDALVIESCGYPGGAPTASITGGTFLSDNAQSVASYAKDENYTAPDNFIPGTSTAKFSDADADGVAEGYTLTPVEGTSNPVLYEVVPAFTILWVAEGVTLQTDVVATNTTPVYTNDVPTKAGHEFLAWSPVPAPAVSNTTYTATWTVKQYDVIWIADGKQFASNRVDYGEATGVPVTDPTKAGDANALYTFAAWTPAPDATVTSNATYTADFKTWTKIAVPAGTDYTYDTTPKTGVAAGEGYTLSGDYAATDAGDYTATATLADTANTVWADDTAAPTANAAKTVSWTIAKAPLSDLAVSLTGWTEGDAANVPSVTGNAGGGAETIAYSSDGETWSGTQPTVHGTYTVKVSVPETANYLAGEATAIFTIDERGVWTVIWLADDGTEIDRTQVTDGDLPTHADATKTDATGKYAYKFTGWSPAIVAATQATNYTATFSTEIAIDLAVPLANHAVDATVNGASATVALAPTGTIAGVTYTAAPAAAWSDATTSFSFQGLGWNAGTNWTVDAAQGADDLAETAHNEGVFYAKASAELFTAKADEFVEFSDMGVAGVGYASEVASAAGEAVRVHTTIDVPDGGLSSEPDVGDAKAGFAVLQLTGDAKPAFYAYNGTTWTKLFGVEPEAGEADYLAVYDFAAADPAVRYYIDGVPLYAEGEGGAKVYAIPLVGMTTLSTIAFGDAEMVKDDVVAVQDVSYVAAVGETPYTNVVDALAAVAAADKAEANEVTLSLLKANLDPGETTVALAAGEAVTVDATGGSFVGDAPFVAAAAPAYKVVATGTAPVLTYKVELDLATVIWLAEDGSTEVWRTNAVIGTVPVYEGPAQTKAADEAALYTFSGWTNAAGVAYAPADAFPAVAVGGTNYVATFKAWAKVARPAVATGLVYDGTEQTGVTVAAGSTATTGAVKGTDAGSYSATVALDSADSVWADATDPADAAARETVTADWSIAKRAITVTAMDASKVAGNTDPGLTASVTDGTVANGQEIACSATRESGEAIATYAITPSATVTAAGVDVTANYDITFVPGTFTITGAQAMVISIADAGTGATATNYVATLADAFLGGDNGAKDGDTVELLGNVTLDARILVTNSVTVDLGGYTVTRTAAPAGDNGSAFRVDGDYDVTIRNGAIDCSGVDDTSVIRDGVFAIDVKNGGNLTLADLDITVDSRNGACVYPWAGSTVAIESGNYANLTDEPYDYHKNAAGEKDWVGMAVNQANGQAQSLITITGGTFSKLNPMLGDDSAAEGTMSFVDPDYFAVADGGAFTVVPRIDIALATVTVADDLVYDGTGKAGVTSVDYGTTNLVLDTDFTVTYAANTNAGTASATLAGIGLWTGTTTANFAIGQRPATFTAASDTKVYDGQPLSTNGFTTANLVEGHVATATVAGSRTEVGASSNVVSSAVIKDADGNDVTANYNVTYKDGELKVTAATITITVAGSTSVTNTFDGTLQTVAATWTATSESPLFDETKINWRSVSAEGTNVGSYDYGLAEAQFLYDDDNVTGVFEVTDGFFAIVPAPVTVKADDASKKHGEADPAEFTATVTGLKGSDTEAVLTYTVSRAPGNDVGTYTITPTGAALQGNYAVTYETGTFTIKSNLMTIIWVADGTETTNKVEWGTAVADFKPADPSKTDTTGKYAYRFDAWTPEVTPATNDATYVASFTQSIATPLALPLDPHTTDAAVDAAARKATVDLGPVGTIDGVTYTPSPAAAWDGDTATFSFSGLAWNQATNWSVSAQQGADAFAETAYNEGAFYAKPKTEWFTATTNQLEAVSDGSDAAVAYTNAVASNEGEMVRVHTKIAVPAGGLPQAPYTGTAKVGFAVLQLENDTAPAYYAFGNGTWT